MSDRVRLKNYDTRESICTEMLGDARVMAGIPRIGENVIESGKRMKVCDVEYERGEVYIYLSVPNVDSDIR